MDHQLTGKHLVLDKRKWGMDSYGNQEIGNYCSMETLLSQSAESQQDLNKYSKNICCGSYLGKIVKVL